MENLPEAPEYRLAGMLLRHLAEDVELEPYVFREPWDRTAQTQALAMAARQFRGVVAVIPQTPGLLSADSGTRTGTLLVRLALVVFATANVTCDKAARRAAGLFYLTLNRALRWDPQAQGIPYALPTPEAIAELDTGQMEGLENLTGYSLTLSIPYNYKQKIKP